MSNLDVMRRNNFLILTLLLLGACKSSTLVSIDESINLFETRGEDYIIAGEASWDIEADEIIGTASGEPGFLITKESYKNFILELSFMADSTVNSGIFIRCASQTMTPIDCHEVNIWDLHPNQKFRTGAIVTKVSPIAHVNTLNKWNTYRIESKERVTKVWIDGTLTAELEDERLLSGPIGLQASGTGVVKFKDVRLTRI